MLESKYTDEELTCKPLDTYKELLSFVHNPPVWRSLCTDMKPHSEYLIKNCEARKNFSQLMLESPLAYCHFNPDTEEEPPRYRDGELPKTLVCHDMANGYHDDSVIDGTSSFDAYTFYNWAGIDIFCYFSHHLITVPPLGWINVAHAHGVKVIGTIITEWNDGATFWSKVLSSELEMQHCISALVVVAKTLKFDGWLLNVENKIAEPEKLLEFVKSLHNTLHQELTDPVLIWYDSVTVDGQLSWQNKLNSKNKAFFDACDGLFTNYSWSPTDVLESVAAADSRLNDLYIGIDVWGRNFFGGGQFNTQEAVKIAHSLGCSLAILAPAWTHEAMSDGEGPTVTGHGGHLAKYHKFQLRDRALWDSLWPFLNTRLPNTLPFRTSFCRGQGVKRRMYGEVLCPIPWYNLRHMQYQPNAAHGPHGYALTLTCNTPSRRDSRGIKIRDSHENIPHDQEKNEIETQTVNKMEFHRDSRELIKLETEESATKKEDNLPTLSDGHTVEDNMNKPKKTMMASIKKFFKRVSVSSTSRSSTSSQVSRKSVVLQEFTSPSVSPVNEELKARVCLTHIADELECLEVFYGDSFIGGSCLKVNPSNLSTGEHRTIRLFHCDFLCEDTLIICFVTKLLKESTHQFLNVHMYAMDSLEEDLRVVLVGRNTPMRSWSSANIKNEYPCPHTDSEFRDMQKYILLNQPDFYVPVENSSNWKVWYFQVALPNVRISSINVRTGEAHGSILLGHFGLCHRITGESVIEYVRAGDASLQSIQ